MDDYPILLFPEPQKADRTKQQRPIPAPQRPSIQRQGERLAPMFARLKESFAVQRVSVVPSQSGIEPELVLVFETVGGVENFANAVKLISGFEWMGEIEADEIAPDEDFYFEDDQEKGLSGRLFLILSNQAALQQMLSLWNRYQADPDMRFQRGLTRFRDVFLCLKNIRRWSLEDRLADSAVLDVWREGIAHDPERMVTFEAELWFRSSENRRQDSVLSLRSLVEQLGGTIETQSVIPSIAYHSVLGKLPASAASTIIENPDVELFSCDSIMFLRPTGQLSAGRDVVASSLDDCDATTEDMPSGEPIVAILDGLPLENHQLLSGRIVVDDPDDWASQYPVIDRQHGTAMSSLVVHGDLNNDSQPLQSPVYVRPIMKPINWFSSPRPEEIPENILFVDFIHNAIRRIADPGSSEVRRSIKIVNLSIGDVSRHFLQTMSPLARLLDWLSYKYRILFVISAGNQKRNIVTGMSHSEFRELDSEEQESIVVKKIYEDARHRKLLSPAESINGITVGSLHFDYSADYHLGTQVELFESSLPSPVSAFGSGYRQSVKPDLIHIGGRIVHDEVPSSSEPHYAVSPRKVAPGNCVAAPSSISAETNKSHYCSGTSNSAALVSRAAENLYRTISEIFSGQAPEQNRSFFEIPILKALLVHGCTWDEVGERLADILNDDFDARKIRRAISRWVGYGFPDFEKVTQCTNERVTLIGCGSLNDGEAHIYKLPLPPSLNARREWRKLTVTLAWLSPTEAATQRYRGAQLWFDFEDGKKSRDKLKNKLQVTGTDTDGHATKRGTVQHEVFEGESAVTVSDGDQLQIKVNCRKDAGRIISPVPYGLVVSFEVAEGIDIGVYEEIQERLAAPVGIAAV